MMTTICEGNVLVLEKTVISLTPLPSRASAHAHSEGGHENELMQGGQWPKLPASSAFFISSRSPPRPPRPAAPRDQPSSTLHRILPRAAKRGRDERRGGGKFMHPCPNIPFPFLRRRS